MQFSVTVAICTWNRAGLLDQTLERMKCLEIPEGVTWELLVVNNNCTDNTDEIIQKHSHALPLKRLFEPKQGQSNARNCALDEARGEWLIWTDDDVDVDPGWLKSFCLTAVNRPDAAAIGGPIEPWFPQVPDPDLMQVFPILRTGYIGIDYGLEEKDLSVEEPIWGANMAFHLGKVKHLRFNPELGRIGNGLLSGDDASYLAEVRSLGFPVVYCPGMRLRHYVEPKRMTEEYLLNFYEGLGQTAGISGQIAPGRSIKGMPLWVIRKMVEAGLTAQMARLSKQRVRRLSALRDYRRCKGMIRGVLASHKAKFKV